jgi:magnesium-transporting ATPase (P-type)
VPVLFLQVLSGACVTQGELEAVVTAVGRNTFFGKTIALLGVPDERGHLQKVICCNWLCCDLPCLKRMMAF